MEESLFEPDNVYTLDEWIEAGKELDISQDKLCLKDRHNDIIIPYQMLVCRYYYALLPFTSEVTFSEKEYLKYRYKPKLLSQDLYDTPELWASIMYINNIVSISDFKKQTIRVFNKSILTILEELMMLAEEDLTKNRISVSS